MPERDIRYCTTEDGVNIAYCVEGEGPTTIIALPAFYESFSLDHITPVYQNFYRELGAGRRIVRFDWRGTAAKSSSPTPSAASAPAKASSSPTTANSSPRASKTPSASTR